MRSLRRRGHAGIVESVMLTGLERARCLQVLAVGAITELNVKARGKGIGVGVKAIEVGRNGWSQRVSMMMGMGVAVDLMDGLERRGLQLSQSSRQLMLQRSLSIFHCCDFDPVNGDVEAARDRPTEC